MENDRRGVRWVWLHAVLLAGCYSGYHGPWEGAATLGGVDESGDDSGGESEPSDPETLDCTEPGAASPVLQRLTRSEYTNTVADLLGVATDEAESFLPDGVVEGFATNAVVPVTPLHVEDYQAAAESIAAVAVADDPGLVPCDPAVVGELACAEAFVDELAPRAFRRPLPPDVRAALLDVFASGETFSDGVRLVITALLQSPDFLYRVEHAEPEADGRLRLDGYSMASRLSYLLWRTMPDDELMALAAADQLDSPEALAQQARRMLDDPRGARVYADFHRQWLGIEGVAGRAKDEERFPGAPALLAAMETETDAFVDEVMRRGDARLETLLTADWTVMSAPLAAHYGAQNPEGPADPELPPGFHIAPLPEGQRAGLLTHGSVMAAHAKPDRTAPLLRGVFTRERVLCTELPDPPPDVPSPPPVDPTVPVREQFEQHSSDPACAGCHELIDDLGFSYEHYDAMGRYRMVDAGGNVVDASAELTGTDVDGPLTDAVDLAHTLAGSEQVRDCMATQWFRFSAARPEQPADECTLHDLSESFATTDGDVRELVIAIVRHPSFAYVES